MVLGGGGQGFCAGDGAGSAQPLESYGSFYPGSAAYSVTSGKVTSSSLISLKDRVDLQTVRCGVIVV